MDLSDNRMCSFCMFLCLSPCLSLYFSTEYKIKQENRQIEGNMCFSGSVILLLDL